MIYAFSQSLRTRHKVRDSLAELLGQTFAPDWEALSVSAAGVRSYRAHAKAFGNPPLKRLEYVGWATPIFFLDQRIGLPYFVAFKANLRRWEQSSLGFKLCNYAVLPKELPNDDS